MAIYEAEWLFSDRASQKYRSHEIPGQAAMATPDPYKPPDEQNLFAAPKALEHARSTSTSNQPGTLAIVISVLIAILVSIPVFMVTFFFTCVGISSMQLRALDNEAGFVVIVVIASLTAILSIVLVTKGLLALVRAFKST